MLVCFNWLFIAGVGIGVWTKYQFAGKPISLVTGVVVGFFIFDLVKHWILK